MITKFTCKPGSSIEIVPLGLLCTLQYNSTGILQKIVYGFNPLDHNDEDIMPSDLTIELKKHNVVPQRISFTKGTTWVKGVFYTKKLFKDEGILPECIKSSMISDLRLNIKDYTFYAGDIKNDSVRITGQTLVSTRLNTLGFNVLPSYLVYDNVDNLPIAQIMRSKKSIFQYPFISGMFICESASDFRYVPANLKQAIVSTTSNYIDSSGNIQAEIQFKDFKLVKSYSEVVQQDIQAKSILLLDEGTEIIHSRSQNTFMRTRLPRKIHCSVCGKSLVVPVRGQTCCEDVHCVSKLYPHIQHFLGSLKLPEMAYDEFKSYMKKKDITCLMDVLILDKYKDLKIECTLSTILFAIVPLSVVRNIDFFQQFTNYLGSVEALDYYIQNPDTILEDLNLNRLMSRNFIDWLKDPANVLELETIINSDQVNILPIMKCFEGAPIFRNKTICITGKFRRGTLEDIVSILQSYSAKVVIKFDNSVDCVVIGHFEDEDTSITELAAGYHVPVYSEDSFFKSYEIDLDIKKQRDMLNSYLK